ALMQILLLHDFQPSGQKSAVLYEGNRELIALVKRWDPSLVASCLLAQLRSDSLTPQANAGIMSTIAELLGDGRMRRMALRYSELSAPDGSESSKSETVNESRMQTLKNFILLANKSIADRTQKILY